MSRMTDLLAVADITRHCTDPRCGKCRAAPDGTGARDGAPERPPSARTPEGSDAVMTATIPLVAIAGFAVYLAYRYMGMRVWHAILCAIFGFLLAATAAAPQISHLITALVHWLQRP